MDKIDSETFKVHAEREWAEKTFKAFFVILRGDDYWVILTTEKKTITEGLIESFLKELYPAVIRIYLNNLQLRVLLQDTAKAYQADLNLKFMAYTQESPDKLLDISARGTGLSTAEEGIRTLKGIFPVIGWAWVTPAVRSDSHPYPPARYSPTTRCP